MEQQDNTQDPNHQEQPVAELPGMRNRKALEVAAAIAVVINEGLQVLLLNLLPHKAGAAKAEVHTIVHPDQEVALRVVTPPLPVAVIQAAAVVVATQAAVAAAADQVVAVRHPVVVVKNRYYG